MTKKEDAISVQVDDEETISIEVEDTPPVEAQPEPKQKEKRTRQRVSPDPVIETPEVGPSPQQALEEAQAYAKQQETARQAAEATAIAERNRAEAAERDRLAAVKNASELAQRADSSEMTLIESNIAAAERELEAQQEAYVRASEAGEFVKLGQIQVKIAKAAAALDRLQDAKVTLESNPRQMSQGFDTPAPPVSSKTDMFLSQFAPLAQNWLRQHMDCLPPEHGGSVAKNSAMMEGHYAALRKSITPNSQEYFNLLETYVNPSSASQASGMTTSTPAPAPVMSKAAAPVPSAPPSREAPTASGQPQARSIREVRLSKEQQEMAKLAFPHLTDQQAYGQYARNLLDLEAEGKIGRTTH